MAARLIRKNRSACLFANSQRSFTFEPRRVYFPIETKEGKCKPGRRRKNYGARSRSTKSPSRAHSAPVKYFSAFFLAVRRARLTGHGHGAGEGGGLTRSSTLVSSRSIQLNGGLWHVNFLFFLLTNSAPLLNLEFKNNESYSHRLPLSIVSLIQDGFVTWQRARSSIKNHWLFRGTEKDF